MKSNRYKLTAALATAIIAASAFTAHAAIINTAHYGLGETGSVTGSAPFAPLVDSIGAHNIENAQFLYAGSSSVSSTGVAAPGSTSYLSTTIAGGGGWSDTSGATNNLSYTSDWATSIWVRPAFDGGTLAFQTDSGTGVTTGESIWLQFNSDLAFGTGNQGITSPTVATTGKYDLGTWYQIQIVNYNGTMNYFVNGTAAGTTARSSTLGALQISWAGGANATSASFDELNIYKFDHTVDSLSNVVAVVPEPSSALLGAVGALALLRRRRA